jgi:hypothetical protein
MAEILEDQEISDRSSARFEESDSMAVFGNQDGVVRSQPVFLADGEPFVWILDGYLRPESLPGFVRYEKIPKARSKAAPLPIHTTEVCAKVLISAQDPLERLRIEQAKWAAEAAKKGKQA